MRQNGYAMLLSLFVLLGASGLWLANVEPNIRSTARNDALELSSARAALIHYAVNYIDHYGPQGAGLGHLPCPDTDKPSATLSDPWHLDGPNPPCAGRFVQLGWLPRHVNVTGGRFHFHTRVRQRLLYAVSPSFVNNPLGRIVNPSVNGDIHIGQYQDVIAVVATPALEQDKRSLPSRFSSDEMIGSESAFTLIRSNDIKLPLMRRSAAWLIDRMNTVLDSRCPEVLESLNCIKNLLTKFQCEKQETWAWMYWLVEEQALAGCVSNLLLSDKFALLEGVPLKRHWFIRNKWYEFIQIKLDDSCAKRVDANCRFVFHSIDGNFIKISLQPMTSLEQVSQ